jgi:hypothetical protein
MSLLNVSFAQNLTIVSPASPGSFVVADFNGDGSVDLATLAGGLSGTRIELHFNNGAGGVASSSSIAGSGIGGQVETADVNGDGYADLLTTTASGFSVYRNDGTGSFYLRNYYTVATGGGAASLRSATSTVMV